MIAIFLILAAHALVWCQGPLDRDLASLRSMVRYQMATDGRAIGLLTNTAVNYAINRALVQVCHDYPALTKYDTILATYDAINYALPSDFDRMRIAYRKANDSIVTITAKTVDEMAEKLSIPKSGPIIYYYTSGQNIVLLPVTQNYDGDTVIIDYFAIDAQLTDSTDSINIPQRYVEKVVDYACFIMAGVRGDYQAAAFYLGVYENKAIVEEMKK
jgi:hypothetical protein